MSILDKFDTNVNFWEVNPQLLYIGEFNEYYIKDKSKGKSNSSQIMWAITLLLDKSKNNNFRNLPEVERKEQLQKHFLNNDNFDWEEDKIKLLCNTYEKLVNTQAMRSLKNWENKMKERDDFINTVSYSLDTFEDLDKMLGTYPKLLKMYQDIAEALQLEDETDDNAKTKYTNEI